MTKLLALPELKQQLLDLNSNADIPFSIIEKDDMLIASWKIVDAKWVELFGLGGIKKQYELSLRFDEQNKQVSYKGKSVDINTEINAERVGFKKEIRYGNRKEFSFETSWGLKTDGSVGNQYSYKFSTADIKNPVFGIIKQSGWLLKQNATDKYGALFLWLVCILFLAAGIIFTLV